MDAWVYLFSKFTHEALLFEALALFLGLFGYAIFYLIRKRKYGVAGKDVPSNIVKVYLGQLVADAEEIRTQLFGLLGKGESSARFLAGLQFQTDAGMTAAPPSTGTGATAAGASVTTTQLVQDLKPDPKLQEKLKELEKRLAEQSNALDSVLNEKMKLEEELANAKNDAPALSTESGDADKGGAGPDRAGPLQERVKQLEAQLAEYAIIEDDLANLKRLQKENKTLKEQLATAAEKGGAPAAAAAPTAPDLAEKPAAPAPAAEAPAAAAPAAEAPNFDLPKEEKKAAPAQPDPSESGGENIATEMVDNLHASDPAHPNDFESLVDVVEKNLADAAKSDTVDPNAPNPEPDFQLESGPTAELISDEKSEEQLQADFEKMLKS